MLQLLPPPEETRGEARIPPWPHVCYDTREELSLRNKSQLNM